MKEVPDLPDWGAVKDDVQNQEKPGKETRRF